MQKISYVLGPWRGLGRFRKELALLLQPHSPQTCLQLHTANAGVLDLDSLILQAILASDFLDMHVLEVITCNVQPFFGRFGVVSAGFTAIGSLIANTCCLNLDAHFLADDGAAALLDVFAGANPVAVVVFPVAIVMEPVGEFRNVHDCVALFTAGLPLQHTCCVSVLGVGALQESVLQFAPLVTAQLGLLDRWASYTALPQHATHQVFEAPAVVIEDGLLHHGFECRQGERFLLHGALLQVSCKVQAQCLCTAQQEHAKAPNIRGNTVTLVHVRHDLHHQQQLGQDQEHGKGKQDVLHGGSPLG